MPKKLTTEDFILRSSEIHNNKYDYSLVEYVDNKTKVKIICNKHGVFEQRPNTHLDGRGCLKCGLTEKLTTEDFIKKSIKSREGFSSYDYSKSIYINSFTKIIVTCPKHGDFLQNPRDHFMNRSNCPSCAGVKKHTNESFIAKAKEIHGDKYDYSLVEYVNNRTKIKIICPEHGVFEQIPREHLKGSGCPICAGNLRHTNESFIEKANTIHNHKYDYSLVKYFDTKTKVEIICPEHGVFEQRPNDHLSGNGCRKCSSEYSISSQEIEIYEYIKSIYSGEVIQSYRPEWLDGKELDLFIPEFNFAIEFNGTYWHSEDQKDKWYHFDKTKKCIDNGIILLHVWEFYFLNPIKKDIYLSKINHYLKMDKVIFARKCKILNINKDVAIDFIRENHLEGFSVPYKNSKYIGLEHNNEIVMVAIYGEFYSQSKKDFEWKLQRVCTLKGCTVAGGISKISKYIKNDIGNFVFQITLDTGGSTLRGKSIERKDVSLRYWWVKGLTFLSRNQTQVSILKKNEDWAEEDSELIYMTRNKYVKIYDSGIYNFL